MYGLGSVSKMKNDIKNDVLKCVAAFDIINL